MANENIHPTEASKVTLTTFRPKRIGGADPSVQKLLLGYLAGQGLGLVEAKGADGEEVFTGMKGTFEARLVDGDGNLIEIVRSGKAFITSPFGDQFISALTDVVNPKTGELEVEAAKSVEFAYAVYVARASNPNGYSWMLEPLMEMKAENDPLAGLKKLLPPTVSGLPQLEAPKEGKKG